MPGDLEPPMTPTSPSKVVLAWMIVSQLGYLLSLLPWLMFSGLAVMAFDAPGSTEMWQPWLFVAVVWSYPLLPLLCSIVAWVLYTRGRGTGAAIATSVPLVLGGFGLILILALS